MDDLKYTVIKSNDQYNEYCNILEELISKNSKDVEDEIELLTLLIENRDGEHTVLSDIEDPVKVLKILMEEHGIRAKDLTDILGLSKGTVSKILNYQKGMSKNTIRKLASYFKVTQDIFNRPYRLVAEPETKYHTSNNDIS